MLEGLRHTCAIVQLTFNNIIYHFSPIGFFHNHGRLCGGDLSS